MSKNIILMGFMGSGKSVTGKALAKRLNMEFIDMDSFIETEQKMSINDIFKTFGESYFRNLETKASKILGKRENCIIALGGGTVANPENITFLKANGDIFYLFVTPETVEKRLQNDTTRPLLAKDKKNTINTLLNKRIPIYEAAADYTINSNQSVMNAVEQILKIVNKN